MSDNLNSLLTWAVKNSTPGGEQPPEQPRAPIDKKWVNALFPDEAAHMKELLSILKDEQNVRSVQEKVESLEELDYLVESIDNANDLVKINGLQIIIPLLSNNESTIRSSTSSVISTCLQNNAYFQRNLIENNGFQVLIDLFKNDTDETVQLKTLGAISGMIKQNQTAEKLFTESQGFKALITALIKQGSSPRICKKVIFLLGNLMETNTNYRKILRENELIPAINQYLNIVELSDIHMVLHTLSEFIKDNKNAELALESKILPILSNVKQKCIGSEDYSDVVQQIDCIQENLVKPK